MGRSGATAAFTDETEGATSAAGSVCFGFDANPWKSCHPTAPAHPMSSHPTPTIRRVLGPRRLSFT